MEEKEKLMTLFLFSLCLLVSFSFLGIDSFRYDYRKCYANCIVDRFNDLKAALRSGELSREDAEMYWEEEIDSCDEKCAKISSRIFAAIIAVLGAFIILIYLLFLSPFIILFLELIHRLLRWLLH
jgi:hypothetical protein